MTTEEQKQQEAKAEKAAKKSLFIKLAQYHEKEAKLYHKQADACDEVVLAPTASSGKFGGL